MAAVDLDRDAQGLHDALSDQLRLTWMQHFRQKHRELIATQPGSGIGTAQAFLQPASDLDQHGVTGRTPELGVDPAEVGEIDGDDADHVALRVTLEQRSLHPIDEQRRIGEMRERIVEGAVGKLVLQCGEPQQRVVQTAPIDRQRGEVRQLLQVSDRRRVRSVGRAC